MAKAHLLRNMPDDVLKIIQREQAAVKQKKKINSYSFGSTIYKMLRDYDKCRAVSPDFKPDAE